MPAVNAPPLVSSTTAECPPATLVPPAAAWVTAAVGWASRIRSPPASKSPPVPILLVLLAA